MTMISGKKRIAILGLAVAAALAVASRAAAASADSSLAGARSAVHSYLSLGEALSEDERGGAGDS